MKNLFKPEFLNRIDASVVFRSLTKDDIRHIIDLLLQRVRAELTEQQMKIDVTDEAKDLLMEKGYDPTYGARPMRRAIQNLIEDPLAEALLEGRFKTGDSVLIDRQGDDLVMTPKTEEAPLAEPAQA
jgi:ATP-dependent Clp protease ATP-binding subunit ClpC